MSSTSQPGRLPAAFLGKEVLVTIDRPLGSKHPRWDFVYPINYGFIPGEFAPDGKELDAYVLGVSRPLAQFRGSCQAIIHRLDDEDDKLIVVPTDRHFTNEQIKDLTDFQERYFNSVILRG